ncbi:transcription antitermination factor NusB [Kroppenstedtia eburnea]|uniref:Transcription antitermination protein NusB n=1 Tax=Kroppenstedtia eburnea TaxID=714067 RepID=A0A1N7ILL2_9BACL|nr:transcription antitermination factor NusB [Kroppenstedtia eburnea]EGK14334.1 N utilization substance protein B [Desmospora sp. 8437]QKI81945.1 transcription antitermination factor NusB [Kroppenstedtia eburnea]SIS37959.1 NusB antitermination factor [Kroppenstedtia eburnea]
MSRRTVREKALQTLYQNEINPDGADRSMKKEARSLHDEAGEEASAFFLRLVRTVIRNMPRLDPVIQGYLKQDWTLSRLSPVDRSILRMAVCELLYEEEIPEGASLNEAVELAKTFSTEESARFINGVLGSMVKNLDEVRKSAVSGDGM